MNLLIHVPMSLIGFIRRVHQSSLQLLTQSQEASGCDQRQNLLQDAETATAVSILLLMSGYPLVFLVTVKKIQF